MGTRTIDRPDALGRAPLRGARRSGRSFLDAISWPLAVASFLVPLALALATIAARGLLTSPELVIRVTDRASGAALAGVPVIVDGASLVTDATGLVSAPAGAPPLAVEIRAPGYAPMLAEVDPAGATQWPVALRTDTVVGTVTDADTGSPIAGAAVRAFAADGGGPATTTAADGAFTLAGVPDGAAIRVEVADYGAVEESLGDRTVASFALRNEVVTGAIRNDRGEPVSGARVALSDGAAETTTNGDGTFRLVGAAGASELVVTSPGFAGVKAPISAARQVEVVLQPESIEAVYAPVGVITDPEKFGELIRIADTTEINAIVLDVKQDTIFYDTQVQFFQDIPNMVVPMYDPAALVAELEAQGIYTIARMVVFKDPIVAESRPDLAIRDEVSGGVWRDYNDAAWVNAFNPELWEANAALAGELASLGFDEVQYDYIRFPSDGDLRTADFGNDYSEELRREAVTSAVRLGAEATRANGAAFAIDLFPIIALFGNDQGIGQTLQDLAPLADYVNLMIYPSHYEFGNIPVDGHPNDFPGETVAYTLEQAEALVPGTARKMRPWLQDFDYPDPDFRDYGPDDVRAQIDAAEAAGASGWILWNAAGEYEVAALQPEQ
jgi:hypothetical protein